MASLPQPARRTFLQGLVFLPLIVRALPTAANGSVNYLCDVGESAFGSWYLSAPGTLYVDWHFLNDFGEFDLRRDIEWSQYSTPVAGWFVPTGNEQLLRVIWSMTVPGWFTGGSCVI